MAPAAMLIESTARHVPRIAPRILFTSKESIASRLVRSVGKTGGPPRVAAAHKKTGCPAPGQPDKRPSPRYSHPQEGPPAPPSKGVGEAPPPPRPGPTGPPP